MKLNKTAIVNKATRTFHKAGFKIKKHSPEILAVAGTIGVGVGVVKACKATTKASEILEDAKIEIGKIHEAEALKTPEYTEEHVKKDLTIVYAKTGVEMAKLYAPSAAILGLSVGALLTSNHILRKRNVALAAAYTAIEKSFKEYRGRVIERFGEGLDRELYYNITTKEVDEIEVNEKGKEKVVKKQVQVVDPTTIPDFSRVFYEGNPGWDKNPRHTMLFLKQQQAAATKKLQMRGYLFLNEVYDMLGFSRVPEGQLIGWLYDENNPIGDNFVDFGIFDMDNESNIRFINGDERGIILTFNHDGDIYKYI